MFEMKSLTLAAAAVLTVALPQAAAASDVAKANITVTTGAAGAAGQSRTSGTYRLRARVPVACWVRTQGALLASADAGGVVMEACNNPGGYTVSASYRPLAQTEIVRLAYGDHEFDLATTGDQILKRSSMATIRSVNYRFSEVRLDQPLVLQLTIQPI